MVITRDAPNKSVTYNFTDEEWTVLVWARQRYGATVAQELVKNWLRDLWKKKEQARLDTLSTAMPVELK